MPKFFVRELRAFNAQVLGNDRPVLSHKKYKRICAKNNTSLVPRQRKALHKLLLQHDENEQRRQARQHRAEHQGPV